MRNSKHAEHLTDAVVETLQEEFAPDKVPDEMRDRIRSAIQDCLNTARRTWITPPELAAEMGVSRDKILYWIHSGELRAVDITKTRGGRNKFRIERESIDEFKKLRENNASPKIPRRRRKAPTNVIEFF